MKKSKISKTNATIIKLVFTDLFMLFLSIFALSLIFSLIFYKIDIEISYATYSTYIIVPITSFCVSYLTTKNVKNNGLLVGIASEIPFLIFIIAEFSIDHSCTISFFVKFLIVILFGAIGGIMSVNKKSKIKVK